MSTRTTDGTYLKEAFASSSKKSTRNKEKKKMAIAKRFALQANAINRKIPLPQFLISKHEIEI